MYKVQRVCDVGLLPFCCRDYHEYCYNYIYAHSWYQPGAQPLIGFNYGAKQYDRVKETLKKSVFVSTIMATMGFIVIWIWPNQIVGLFSKGDLPLTELTVHAMLTFFALLPFIGVQILGSSYFQAVGKPVQSTLLSLSRQVLLFIPLLIILPRIWGIEGVWRTAPIADTLSVLITVTVILFEMRSLPKSTPKPLEQPKENKEQLLKLLLTCRLQELYLLS